MGAAPAYNTAPTGAVTISYADPPAPPKREPIVNQYPKIGRNDPCPCGSGHKFKHCHRLALKVGAAFLREGTRCTSEQINDEVAKHVNAKFTARIVNAMLEARAQ